MGRLVLLTALLMAQGRGQLSTAPSFSLSISATADSVKAGSDVTVKVSLTNRADHEIRIVTSDPPELEDDIEIRNVAGAIGTKTRRYKMLKGEDTSDGFIASKHSVRLKPGETTYESIVVSKLYDLVPGRYTVQIIRKDPETKAEIRSNTITITVTP